MRKHTLLLFASVLPFVVRAQEVLRVQNGAILSVQSGGILTLSGGITLASGSQLVNNGAITLLQNGSSGAADWLDNTITGYGYGTGTFVFGSNAAQNIASNNSFQQINVNNAGLTLGSNIIANNWYLVKGVVNTGTFKAIALSTAAAAVQADPTNAGYTNSWISGTMRRFISPATVNGYDFPAGGSTRNNLLTLANLTASPLSGTQYLDVSFGSKPGTDAGLLVSEWGTPFSTINSAGVWHITPDAEPTTGKYDLLLYLGGFTGLADNDFAILERPDGSSNAAQWAVPAGSTLPNESAPGRLVSSGYARQNSLSAFSQFGLGMTITPLPVTLIGFDAKRVTTAMVILDWQTSMEENNKGFGIDRRLENEPSFAAVGFVPSSAPDGNSSSTLSYSYIDPNGYSGVSYYRLEEQSLDGHLTYTLIRAVSGSGGRMVVSLYPNPGHGQFTLRVDGTDKPFMAVITDERGRLIRRIDAYGGTDVSITGLHPGLYVIHLPDIFGQGQSFTEKVLIVP